MNQGFDTVVGLEVHVQLNTKSKAFCGDRNEISAKPNNHISPISLAYPGTLPRINEQQVKLAIKLGLALNCSISQINAFDRKNYFYPDSPKGYQITQDEKPICIGGEFTFVTGDKEKTIRLHHIHMEEDAGKSIHEEGGTLLDYNRAGTPLLEVVTEPDFQTGQEVSDFMSQFQILLRFLDISDANMEEGSLRCDCNVSVKPLGSSTLGTRCEVKNLNSKRFAKLAVEHESLRQINEINAGNTIIQESRLFDSLTGKTYPMRKKEDALDYRYFPDPDLQILSIEDEMIDEIKASMGLLPWDLRKSLIEEYQLSQQAASLISQNKANYNQFVILLDELDDNKLVANFIVNQIIPIQTEDVDYQSDTYNMRWIELLKLIKEDKLSASLAYQRLIPIIIEKPDNTVFEIADSNNLLIERGTVDYEQLCFQVLVAYPEKVNIFRKGKKGLMGFFIGEAMKKGIKGINPKDLQSKFENLLNED